MRSAAAWPSSTATATAGRTSTWPAGAGPAALYRNDEPHRRSAPVHRRSTHPADGRHGGHRRLPDRHRRRRPRRPGRPAARRRGPPARPRRLPLRARQRALVVRRRDGVDDRVQRDVGGRRTPCRRSPSATTSTSTRHGKPTVDCAENDARSGPPRAGTGYGPPIALAPGYCTLSMLFSDWDRSGPPRPARHATTGTTTASGTGAAVAGGSRRAAAAVHGRRRLGADADLGHGHRELRRHRRRLPGRLPDEPGRQQAPDADRGAGHADLPRHRAPARRHRGPAVHRRRHPAVDRLAPGVRRTSTTTGSSTCSSRRATSAASRTTRRRIRATCSSASRTGRSSRRPSAAGILSFDAGPGRGPRRLQPRRAARPRRGQLRGPGAALAERRGPATAAAPAAMGNWLDIRLSRAGSEPRRDRRLDRGPRRQRDVPPRADDRRRPHRRPARLRPRRPRLGARRRRSASSGRTARSGRGCPWRRTRSTISSGARRRPARGTPAWHTEEARDGERPGSHGSTCRTSGCPRSSPSCPASALRRAARPAAARADARGYDVVVVYADREHSAIARLADRLRPPLRGGDPHRRARPATRPSSSATSATGWPAPLRCPMRRDLFQDLSLPSQPRDRSRPLAEILGRRGHRAGRADRRRRLEDVRPAGHASTSPSYLVDELRAIVGPTGSVENADRPAHRRGRRAAGDQRGRAARGVRVRVLPDLGRRAPRSCAGSGRG